MVNVTFINARPYAVNISLEGPTNTAFNVAANGQTVQNVNAGVYPTIRFTSPNKVVTVDQLRLAAGTVVRTADYLPNAANVQGPIGADVTFVNARAYAVTVQLQGPTNKTFNVAAGATVVQNISPGVYPTIRFTSPSHTAVVDDLSLIAGTTVRIADYLAAVADAAGDAAPAALLPATSIKVVNDTRSAATVRLEADAAPMLQLAVGTNVDLRVSKLAEPGFTVMLNGRSARVDVRDLRSSIVLYLTSIFPIALPAGVQVNNGDFEIHTSASAVAPASTDSAAESYV